MSAGKSFSLIDASDKNLFSNNFKLYDSLLKEGWWYTLSIIDNNIM